MLSKIISGGDPARTTRFHTEQDELINVVSLARDLPKCLYNKLLFRKKKRLPSPWWPTRVIPKIEHFLRRKHNVIEFGSGSSTIWLSQRAGFVVSFESSREWSEVTKVKIENSKIANAEVIFAQGAAYFAPSKHLGPFDLAIVDGDYRWKCVEHILPRMKSGGLLYLDNADSDKDLRLYEADGPMRRAQSLMEDYAKAHEGARLEKVKSLIDGELFAGEGWLLYIP